MLVRLASSLGSWEKAWKQRRHQRLDLLDCIEDLLGNNLVRLGRRKDSLESSLDSLVSNLGKLGNNLGLLG